MGITEIWDLVPKVGRIKKQAKGKSWATETVNTTKIVSAPFKADNIKDDLPLLITITKKVLKNTIISVKNSEPLLLLALAAPILQRQGKI